MVRVVLDANVIVSAAFGGRPMQAVTKAFRDEVFLSPAVKQELLLLPEELAFKLSLDQKTKLKRLINVLIHKSKLVIPQQHVDICRDQKDNAYLSLCLSAGTDYLVTGDLNLLSIGRDQLKQAGLSNLNILTPKKFLSARI